MKVIPWCTCTTSSEKGLKCRRLRSRDVRHGDSRAFAGISFSFIREVLLSLDSLLLSYPLSCIKIWGRHAFCRERDSKGLTMSLFQAYKERLSCSDSLCVSFCRQASSLQSLPFKSWIEKGIQECSFRDRVVSVTLLTIRLNSVTLMSQQIKTRLDVQGNVVTCCHTTWTRHSVMSLICQRMK